MRRLDGDRLRGAVFGPISHAPDRIRFATPSCCRARVQCEPAWGAALKPARISHGLQWPRRSQSAANTMGILVVARLTARAVVVLIATITSTFSSRSKARAAALVML